MKIAHALPAMTRPLPPLRALEAFAEVMRHGSFTRAATVLGLTQSAVSHQMRTLEERLGVSLFSRTPTGPVATPSAAAFLPHVTQALASLRAGAEHLAQRGTPGVLSLSVSPSFAAKWLVPRLGRLIALHPDLDLRVSAEGRHVDLAAERIDMAVRHGDGRWPGLDVVRLCVEEHLPLCSPAIAAGPPPLGAPGDLARHVLLHDRDRSRWDHWLAAAGMPPAIAARGPIFDQTSLVIDAAVAGQGVALARSALAALDLIAGRLVMPLAPTLPAAFAYWIVCLPAARQRREVQMLRHWLLAEARADRRAINRLRAGRARP
jgi:LysR family glycine cleavage system transcriptional activator